MPSARLDNLPSRSVLSELPLRALLFLRGVATHAAIRAAMSEGGFGEVDHREGARLLEAVYAWDDGGIEPSVDRPAVEAGAAIERFVRDHFPRLRVAIERLHPERVALFAGLQAGTVPEAITALGTFLARVQKTEDAGVRETLAQRGVGSAERQRLSDLLAVALSVTKPAAADSERKNRDEESFALYRWYTDWTTTARVLIKRKDWLVLLGLAERKRARLI